MSAIISVGLLVKRREDAEKMAPQGYLCYLSSWAISGRNDVKHQPLRQ